MKKVSVAILILAAFSSVAHAARPVDAPSLCEVQIEAFEYQLSLAKTVAEKEKVKERWRNAKPSWRAACVKSRLNL